MPVSLKTVKHTLYSVSVTIPNHMSVIALLVKLNKKKSKYTFP